MVTYRRRMVPFLTFPVAEVVSGILVPERLE